MAGTQSKCDRGDLGKGLLERDGESFGRNWLPAERLLMQLKKEDIVSVHLSWRKSEERKHGGGGPCSLVSYFQTVQHRVISVIIFGLP